jgi:polyisoprenyl-phosphate glycosyltransferase
VSQPRASYRADVVVPCYNEEAVLPHTIPVIRDYLEAMVRDPANRLAGYRLLLVDDGSKDRTWPIIEDFAASSPPIEGIKLSRNFGHQSAMLAGLSNADADVVLTMDCDLQDDISAVARMFAAYETGSHLALGVRTDRSSDARRKSGPANAYYRLLSVMGIDIVENHADFRLMSRTALDALLQYREANLFLRGLIPHIGFPVTLIPYARQPRALGETKYTMRKMLGLAVDGITSFSVLPLRLISLLGAALFAVTVVTGCVFLYLTVTHSAHLVPGWASTVLPVLFLGGVQLLSLGVLGEYVGKIYLETKHRPRFIVEERTATDADVAIPVLPASAARIEGVAGTQAPGTLLIGAEPRR